jgi:uncharacterized protein YkwD
LTPSECPGKLVRVLSRNSISALFLAGLLTLAAASGASAAGTQQSEAGWLRAVNATRAAHGLRPLRLDPRLESAARSWSASLLRENVFTHGDFASRMRAFHVGGLAGENLAWASGSGASPQSVLAMWLASPGHRANLLKPSYRRIGVGVAHGTFQGYGGAAVVTADFSG